MKYKYNISCDESRWNNSYDLFMRFNNSYDWYCVLMTRSSVLFVWIIKMADMPSSLAEMLWRVNHVAFGYFNVQNHYVRIAESLLKISSL